MRRPDEMARVQGLRVSVRVWVCGGVFLCVLVYVWRSVSVCVGVCGCVRMCNSVDVWCGLGVCMCVYGWVCLGVSM